VPIRLAQLRVPINKIDALFLTHFHSDHTSGIPDLWLTSWLFGRTDPFPVVGPVGTKDLTENLERAYAADIKIRLADEKLPAEGVALRAEEFTTEGLVYDKNGVRVSAFEVDRGDLVKPAYGYRIDYQGKSVVISGDTRFNENVIKHATGADVLIHEVGVANPGFSEKPKNRTHPRPPFFTTRGWDGIRACPTEAGRLHTPYSDRQSYAACAEYRRYRVGDAVDLSGTASS
jgi:ribonuclease Z